jgi:uncharacterized protein with PIN domain/sulfur carrier protein ThiS
MTAVIRFYQELNDFLPMNQRKRPQVCSFQPGTTVKKIIEDLGVPHTEVDLVLVNGESEHYSYQLKDNDRISVYPVFEAFDISSLSRVRPSPLRTTAFVLDVHLGKLAAMLRMVGLDSAYRNDASDQDIVEISLREKRIILSRDRELLKRKAVSHGYYVKSKEPVQQFQEILHRFQLEKLLEPFSRCLQCNTLLEKAAQAQIEKAAPASVRRRYEEFKYCRTCGKIFWRGSHWRSMVNRINAGLGFPFLQ